MRARSTASRAVICAQQEAEREALRLTVAAQAERNASEDRGAAVRAEAEAQADAERIRALAQRVRHEVEAEGTRLMNEAQNTLTPEARLSALRMRLLDKIEGIVRESVRPMERIDGIKILQVDGLGGGGRREGFDGGANMADSLVNSALRYRAQAPLVDQLLREIGVDGGDLGKVARGILERQQGAAQLTGEPAPPVGD